MSHTKATLSLLLLGGLVAITLVYVVNNLDQFAQLSLEAPHHIAPLVPLFFVNLLMTGLTATKSLQPLGLRLSLFDVFRLAVVTRFFNLVTPFRGGIAARALYLKLKHDFPYSLFISALAISHVLLFMVASVIGIAGLSSIATVPGRGLLLFYMLFFGVFLASIALLVFPIRLKYSQSKLMDRVARIVDGWQIVRQNLIVIATVLLMAAGQVLTLAMMLYFQFRVFGTHLDIATVLFLAAFASLGVLVAVTPAGLGIQEALIVFSAAILGISPAVSLSSALLGRGVRSLILLMLGPAYSYSLTQKKPGS